MPKGVPFAEGLSALEHQRLVAERPYVNQLYNSDGTVNYEPMKTRLTQFKHVGISAEESVLIDHVIKNLKRDLYVTEHILGNKDYPVPQDAYIIDDGNRVRLGHVFPASIHRNYYYPLNFSDYPKGVSRRGRLHRENSSSSGDIHLLHTNAPVGTEYWTSGAGASKTGKNARNLFQDHKQYILQCISQIDAGRAATNAYQAEQAEEARRQAEEARRQAEAAEAARQAAEARRQEELRQKAQAEAAKASYENALKFKTEEFNRALAAQKAESETTRKKLLNDFDAQAANIRTDLTRIHQMELAKREEEYGRRSKDYEARLAQFAENFERQAKELSGVRLEIAKQKTDYENQLAARKLEESKRKQEAEVLQSNLKRRIAIYEAGRGANLHFVGFGKDGQSKGARVFANSGGRYVKSRISYAQNGGFRYLNSGSEDSDVPDLFLDALSPSNKKKVRK